MNEDHQTLSQEICACDSAIIIIDKYINGELSIGKYVYELIRETYINLISQAQSGQVLCIEGEMLDIQIDNPHPIKDTNNFVSGYKIGKFRVCYTQNSGAMMGDYYEDATIIISMDDDQLNNTNLVETILYNGTFKDITQEGLHILEKCLRFSALHYDLFLDKKLLKTFSENIQKLNGSLNDLPILDDKKHKL